MHNLLAKLLIRFSESRNFIVKASLPEVYAALMADDIDAFPALRSHRRHAWHAFLVQLGVIAMHRARLTKSRRMRTIGVSSSARSPRMN